MQDLIKKLNIAFAKRPNQIRTILTCLNDLSNERNVTFETVKVKLLPLLKGNQLLIDWFMQLFGKPLNSPLSEYETINMKKNYSDDVSEEFYEEIQPSDLIESDNIDELKRCGVQYRNGKIYYYCGSLLPAKIAFLALDAKVPESPKSDEPKGLCVHAIRNHVTFTDKEPEEEPAEIAKKTSNKKKIKKESKDSDEDKQNKLKKKKKSIICDANTLHAHAVRLNPVHAQNGERLSDLSHYFTRSPKKTRTKKTGNSPEKTSPTAEQSHFTETSPTQPSPPFVSKIKLEDSSDEPVKKKPRITTTIVEKSSSLSAPKKQRLETSSTSATKKDKVVQDRSSDSWTRDEDKIILEEIKIGCADKEKVIGVLLSKLNRSKTEIQQRHEFLIELVKMMN